MQHNAILIPALAMSLLAGCYSEMAPFSDASDKLSEPPAVIIEQPAMLLASSLGIAGGAERNAPRAVQQLEVATMDRKLVRRGSIELEVEDVERAVGVIDSLGTALGGFVANTQVMEDAAGHHSATITLRIPDIDFSSAVSALDQLGKVRNHSVSSEDVTKAYYDLETPLAVTRETEARLRELLTRKTGDLSDVLQVERELSRVIGMIEAMEGERRYYDNQIALATITITLYEPDAIVRAGAMDPLRDALRRSVQIFIASIAVMIQIFVVLVPWLVLAAVVALAVKKTGWVKFGAGS